MLVLARKKNQAIFIEPNIRIVIVSIDGDVVRLGIDAPKNIRIERDDMKSGPKPVPHPVSCACALCVEGYSA